MVEHPLGGVVVLGGMANYGTPTTSYTQTSLYWLQTLTGPWVKLSTSMTYRNMRFVAMLVPDTITNCVGEYLYVPVLSSLNVTQIFGFKISLSEFW